MEKNKNPWLSYEKISTGSDAFAYTQDLGYELSDSFEHLNQGSPVRAKGIPTEKYTAGNTNDISEGVTEDTFLTQTPSKVTRRYSPTNKSEYSGYRPPDPVFVAFNNQKSNTIVPQPQMKAKTLEDLNRKEITIKTVSTKQLAANKKNDLLSPEARELLMVLGGKDGSFNNAEAINNSDDSEETIEVIKYTSTIKPIEIKTLTSSNNVVVNNSQPIIISNKTNTKIAPLITQSQAFITNNTSTNIISNEENNVVNDIEAKEVSNTTNTVINISKAKPSPFISRYTEPISFNTFSTTTATEIIDQKTQNKINKRNEINLSQIVTEVNNLVKNINNEFKTNITSNLTSSISGTDITKHENILNSIDKIILESTNIENLSTELSTYLDSVKNENNISIVAPIENYIKNNLINFVSANQNSVENSINSEYQNYVTKIVEEISENIVNNKFEESYTQLFTFLSSINNIQNETLKQEINLKLNNFSKSLYSGKEEYFNSIISDVKNNVNIFDNENINQLNSYINEYMSTSDIKTFQNNVNTILLLIRSENNVDLVDQITNNINQNYASLITNSLENFSSINKNELIDVTNNAIKNEVKIQISNTILPEVKEYISNLYSNQEFTNITNQLNNILNQSNDANVIKMAIENYLNEYSSTEYSTFVENVITIVNQNIDKLNQETINVFNNSKFQNEIKNVVIKSLGSLSNNIVQNISETKYQSFEDKRLSTLINSIQTINNVLENNTSSEYALQNLNMVNNSVESYLNEASTELINQISESVNNNQNIDVSLLNQVNQSLETNSLTLNQKALSLITMLNDYKVQNNTNIDLEFIDENNSSVQVFNTLNIMKEQISNHIDSYMNETLDMVVKLNNSTDIFNTSKLINLVEETITQLTNIGISSSTINEIKQSLNISESKSFNEIFQMINSQSKIENDIKNYILKNNSSLSDFTLTQVQNIINQPKYAGYESFSYIKNIIEENSSQTSYEILNEISNFIANFNNENNQELINNLNQVVNNYKSQVVNASQNVTQSNIDIKNILIQELTENNINGLTYNLATAAYSENINNTNEQLNTILNEISNSSTFNESNLKQLETVVNLSSTDYLNNSIVEELEQNFTSNNYSKNDVKNYIDQKKNELTISTLSQLKSIALTNSDSVDNTVINYFNSEEANEEVINQVRNYLVNQSSSRNLSINEQSILTIVQSIASQNNFLSTINNLIQNNNSENNTLSIESMTALNFAYQVQEILNNSNLKNIFENTASEIKNDVSLSITEIINYEKAEIFNSLKQQILNVISSTDTNNSVNLNNINAATSFQEIREYLNNSTEISNETKNVISFISNSQAISTQQIDNITNRVINNIEQSESETTNILNQIAEYKNINLNDFKNENASYNLTSTITQNTFDEIQNILSTTSSATSEIIQNLINETNNKFEYKAAEVIFNIDKQEQAVFNNLVNELVSTISNSTNITNNQELLTSLNSSFEKYDVDIDVENLESTQIDSTVVLRQIKDIREQLSHVSNYSSANETINNFKSNSLQEIKNQFSSIFNNNPTYQNVNTELTSQLNNINSFNDLKQFISNNNSLINNSDLETISKYVNNQSTVNNIVEQIESIYRFKNIQKISSNASKEITYVEVLNYLENNLNNPVLINQITSNLINSRNITDLKNIIQSNVSTFSTSQLEQINNIVSKNENYISQINNATNEEQITNILNESKKEVINFTVSQITNYLLNNNNSVVQNFLSKSLQENIQLNDFVTLINDNKKYLTAEDNTVIQNILSKTEMIRSLYNQSFDVNNFEESINTATSISDQKTYMETLNLLSSDEKFETLQNNVTQMFSENKSILELQTIINSNTEIFNDEEKSTINNILEQNKKENNLYQSATTTEEVKNIFNTMQSNLVQKSVADVANYLVNNTNVTRLNNLLSTEIVNNSNSINEIKTIIENNATGISKYDYAILQNIVSKNELLQNSFTSIQNLNVANGSNVNNNFDTTQNTMLQIVSYLSTVLNEQTAQNILEKISKDERIFENINSYVQEIKNELTQEQIINVQNIVAKNESLNKYSNNTILNLEIDTAMKYNIENELISQAGQIITNNISSNRNQYISELKSVLETNVENQSFNTESLISQITNTVNEYSDSAENVVSNLFESMDIKNYQNVSNSQKQEILNKINTFIQSYNFENILTNVLNNNVNINQNIVNNESIKLLTEISNSNLNTSRLETNYNNAINNSSLLSTILNTENQASNNSNIISNYAGSNNSQINTTNNNVNLVNSSVVNNQSALNINDNNVLQTQQNNIQNIENIDQSAFNQINNQLNQAEQNKYNFRTLEQIFAQKISNQFESAYNHVSSINNIRTNNIASYQNILNQVRQFIENKNNTTVNTVNTEINNTVSRIENIVTIQNQETVNYAQEALSIVEQNVKNITENNNLPSNVNKLTTEDNNYFNIESNISSTNTVSINNNEENIDVNNLRIEKVWDTFVQKEVSKIVEEVEKEKKESSSIVNNVTNQETVNNYTTSTENKNIYEINNEQNTNETHYHQSLTSPKSNNQIENITNTKTTNIENINIQEMTETVFSKIEQRFKTYNITHEDMIILKNKILTEVVEIYERRTTREIEQSELRIKQEIQRMFKQFLNS